MYFEVVGDLPRGVPIQTHQNSLDAQHHPRLPVPLSLSAELQQLGDGGLLALCKDWAHTTIIAQFRNNVELFMRRYIEEAAGYRRRADVIHEIEPVLAQIPNTAARACTAKANALKTIESVVECLDRQLSTSA